MRVLEICRIFRRQSSQYAILACSLRNVSTICEGDTSPDFSPNYGKKPLFMA
jgi:hypothetical protein